MTNQAGPPSAIDIMIGLGLTPDPWQIEVLESRYSRLLLNCARQSGKSTIVAVLALSEAICTPCTKVLLLSRSLRQSAELFRIVWGMVKDGVLILTGEHDCRGKPLSHHAAHLPRGVLWYADPSGANERPELLSAGFNVREGNNSLRPGIAAVTARLESGDLRVLAGRCPNLLAEAGRHRYSDDPREHRAETPLDEHNHALAALRYLISGLDKRNMARIRQSPDAAPPKPPKKERPWLRWDKELYHRLH